VFLETEFISENMGRQSVGRRLSGGLNLLKPAEAVEKENAAAKENADVSVNAAGKNATPDAKKKKKKNRKSLANRRKSVMLGLGLPQKQKREYIGDMYSTAIKVTLILCVALCHCRSWVSPFPSQALLVFYTYITPVLSLVILK
jgi:hypothetical protein